jgi:carbonic anhydrase/acetyltransferase-like protein (isoleucine patch superfamily)
LCPTRDKSCQTREIAAGGDRSSTRNAYVAPTAVLCGGVRVGAGAGARVLFDAALTAEDGAVEVGERCVVIEPVGRSPRRARTSA